MWTNPQFEDFVRITEEIHNGKQWLWLSAVIGILSY